MGLLVLFLVVCFVEGDIFLGDAGQNCFDVCFSNGMNCNYVVATDNTTKLFSMLGINCGDNVSPVWKHEFEPAFNSSSKTCLGYQGVPSAVACQAREQGVQRICNCDKVSMSSGVSPFGTAYSQGLITPEENTMFAHHLNADFGTMTHFWMTPSSAAVEVISLWPILFDFCFCFFVSLKIGCFGFGFD